MRRIPCSHAVIATPAWMRRRILVLPVVEYWIWSRLHRATDAVGLQLPLVGLEIKPRLRGDAPRVALRSSFVGAVSSLCRFARGPCAGPASPIRGRQARAPGTPTSLEGLQGLPAPDSGPRPIDARVATWSSAAVHFGHTSESQQNRAESANKGVLRHFTSVIAHEVPHHWTQHGDPYPHFWPRQWGLSPSGGGNSVCPP